MRFSRGWILGAAGVVLGCGLFGVAACKSDAADGDVVSRGPVPEQFFGMHFHRAASTTRWPEGVGIASWRLWDAYTAWFKLETGRDQWTWTILDKSVAVAQQQNVELLLTLGLTPAYASARPQEKSSYGDQGQAAEPASIDDWTRYVRTVVGKYQKPIRYYEIWNEPDLKGFYTGTPQKMAELTKAACKEIRAIDPDIKIVSPSPTSGPWGFKWFKNYLDAMGPQPCFDIVGWHFYTMESTPEKVVSLAAELKSLLRSYKLEKMPIWNTEAGYYIENITGPKVLGTVPAHKLTLDQGQAQAFYARAMLLSWSSGIDRYYWYSWDSNIMGTLDFDTGRPKPMATAIATTAKWMKGAVIDRCTQTDGYWSCEVKRDGQTQYAVWVEQGTQLKELPSTWKFAQITDLDGRTQPLRTHKIELSIAPVLLTP